CPSPMPTSTSWRRWPKTPRAIGSAEARCSGNEPPRSAGREPEPSPDPAFGALGLGAQAELVEAPSHGVRRHTEQTGDGADVARPDGDQLSVEVLALHLDHAHEAP